MCRRGLQWCTMAPVEVWSRWIIMVNFVEWGGTIFVENESGKSEFLDDEMD